MDRLTPFFSHLSLTARVFFAGNLCGQSTDHITRNAGQLHVLRSGVLTVRDKDGNSTVIKEPSVLLYPRSEPHTFVGDGADLVCAFVEFGEGALNPFVSGLPTRLSIPISSIPELAPTIDLLFAEAFSDRDGREIAVDRLAEYFLLLLLRSALDLGLIHNGTLPALANNNLAKAVKAIHAEPERAWTLEELGHIAGMSRARFAAHFLSKVGQTPFTYLALCRIRLAQSLLKRGEPLKMVAPTVGYASAGALIRSFSHHVGMPPMTWLAAQQQGAAC